MYNITDIKTVDMLTKDIVSILTQKYINIDGVQTQIGVNNRCAYSNSENGRDQIAKNEPQDIVNSVFSIWGDTPTVEQIV